MTKPQSEAEGGRMKHKIPIAVCLFTFIVVWVSATNLIFALKNDHLTNTQLFKMFFKIIILDW